MGTIIKRALESLPELEGKRVRYLVYPRMTVGSRAFLEKNMKSLLSISASAKEKASPQAVEAT